MIGSIYDDEEEFSLAIEHFQQALSIRSSQLGEESLAVSSVYNNLGLMYKHKGEYDKAISHLGQSLSIKKKLLGHQSPRLASTLLNLGTLLQEKGDWDQALNHYQEALKIRENAYDTHDLRLAPVYQGISVVYRLKGDFDLALRYLNRGLTIVEESEGLPSARRAQLLQNKGVLYEELGEYEKAIVLQTQALEIYQQHNQGYVEQIAACHHNIGINYLLKQDYSTALFSLEKSLSIKDSSLRNPDTDAAKILSSIGDCLYSLGNLEQAEEKYQRALKIRKEAFGKHHPLVARSYNQLGKVSGKLGKKYQALQRFQMAISANVPGFNDVDPFHNPEPEPSSIMSERVLIQSLLNKADILLRGNLEECYYADSMFSLAIEVAEQTQRSYREDADRLHLQNSLFEVYEKALHNTSSLYQQTHDISLLYRAFELAEKSRGALLFSSLRELSAKQVAGIPVHLLRHERQLRMDLTFYKQQIFAEEQKGYQADLNLLNRFQYIFLTRKNTYDSLIQVFEKNYPEYHHLKYDLQTISVPEIQRELLGENEHLIEYFVGDSSVYVFHVLPDTLVLKIQPLPFDLKVMVNEWRKSFSSPQFFRDDPSMALDIFVQRGYTLYQLLLEGVLSSTNGPQKLWIVPGGILGYLPFDIMLKRLPEDADSQDFLSLDYVGKEHIISYAYSATLLKEQIHSPSRHKASLSLAGYAPNYSVSKSDEIHEDMGARNIEGGTLKTSPQCRERGYGDCQFVERACFYR